MFGIIWREVCLGSIVKREMCFCGNDLERCVCVV